MKSTQGSEGFLKSLDRIDELQVIPANKRTTKTSRIPFLTLVGGSRSFTSFSCFSIFRFTEERVAYRRRTTFVVAGVSSSIRGLLFCFEHDRVTTGIIPLRLKSPPLNHRQAYTCKSLHQKVESFRKYLNFTSNGAYIPYVIALFKELSHLLLLVG